MISLLRKYGAILIPFFLFLFKEKPFYLCLSIGLTTLMLLYFANELIYRKIFINIIAYVKGFWYSFWEILFSSSTNNTVAGIYRYKKSNHFVKNILKEYMKEEAKDLKGNLIVTTFSNYSSLVSSLVNYSKSKIGEDESLVYLTQNAVDFSRWFNFKHTSTSDKWVKYLREMYKFSKDDSIIKYRFMAFTTENIAKEYCDTKGIDINSLPFYRMKSDSSDDNTVIDSFLEHFKNSYIKPKNAKYFDDILDMESPIDELLLSENTEIEKWEEEQKNTTIKNNGHKYHFKIIRAPVFKVFNPGEEVRYSINVIDAVKKLFHSQGGLNALFLKDLNQLYSGTKINIAEDFFAIGHKKGNNDKIDWKIILATVVDENLKSVQLFFLTPNLNKAKSPDSSVSISWNSMVSYIDNKLLAKGGFPCKEL